MAIRGLDVSDVRVYVTPNAHPIYEELVSQARKNAEYKPFSTMKDLFMAAACMGAQQNLYEPLESRRDIFSGQIFREKIDVPILAALAYQKEQDVTVLSDPKKVVEIAQGWANGGIYVLQNELVHQAGSPLYNLVNMILK